MECEFPPGKLAPDKNLIIIPEPCDGLLAGRPDLWRSGEVDKASADMLSGQDWKCSQFLKLRTHLDTTGVYQKEGDSIICLWNHTYFLSTSQKPLMPHVAQRDYTQQACGYCKNLALMWYTGSEVVNRWDLWTELVTRVRWRSMSCPSPTCRHFLSCSFHGDKIRGEGISPPTGVHKNMIFKEIPANLNRLIGLTNATKEIFWQIYCPHHWNQWFQSELEGVRFEI